MKENVMNKNSCESQIANIFTGLAWVKESLGLQKECGVL